MQFLKENWIWIAIPFGVIVLGVAVIMLFMSGDSGGDDPFIYNIW